MEDKNIVWEAMRTEINNHCEIWKRASYYNEVQKIEHEARSKAYEHVLSVIDRYKKEFVDDSKSA